MNTKEEPRIIEDIEKLTISPGDFLVIKYAGEISSDQLERCRITAKSILPEGCKVLTLPKDWDAEALNKEQIISLIKQVSDYLQSLLDKE